MKRLIILAAAIAAIASGAAMARNYSQQEAWALMAKIRTKPPETLPDLIKRYGLKVRLVTAGDADGPDLANGYRRGDVIVSVLFDQAGFAALPCGFKTRTAGRLAEFVKRGEGFLPESELAKWFRTGQCPAP